MEEILVVDFGGQYTQLIAKSVRKCNVFSEIVPCEMSLEDIVSRLPKGVILSGGPSSVYQENAPRVAEGFFEALPSNGIHILGICYGMQLENYTLGGEMIMDPARVKEYGDTRIFLTEQSHPLFSGLESEINAWMSHGDSVDGSNLARGFRVLARTKDHVAAIANENNSILGVQFHPEVTHTPKGLDIISNFVHGICGCGNEWTMKNYIEQSKRYVQETVGDDDIICFVSGGVDSCYTATVLSQTPIPGKKYFVYIDSLMRKGETEEVVRSLKGSGIDLIVIRAEDRFIDAVKGMSDPEQKRKAIGNLYGIIMTEIVQCLGLDPNRTKLAQGTLYTDLIESGKGVGKKAANIKSHHNVGCKFIDDLKARGMVVEPNRLIFKDEVRQAAREIGLPPEISERQPFPGPGLGIRIVDGVDAKKDPDYYRANVLVQNLAYDCGHVRVSDVIHSYALEGRVLPIRTVGVQGDERTYRYLALLRGDENWSIIRSAAERIPKEIPFVNRVVFDPSPRSGLIVPSQYPHTIIPTQVTRETVDLLKEIDYEGRKIIDSYGFTPEISQTIFVLFGSDYKGTGKRSVAGRFVQTDDFMTVSPIEPLHLRRDQLEEYRKTNGPVRMTWECVDELYKVITTKYPIGSFVIDVTDKPPSTTCWE